MCVCVRERERERGSVCVLLLDWEGNRTVPSRDLAVLLLVVEMALYLTSYSDYLIGFYEPLSPPYKCDTGLKNVFVITG